MDKLVHVKVDIKLRQKMESLVSCGLFGNQSEIVREGLRDLLQKYG